MNKKLALFALPLLLSGCETIYGWADSAGSHFPTIGEPCRHWQCVTEEGQRQSDLNRRMEEAAKNTPAPKPEQQAQPKDQPQQTNKLSGN
jgi:hypothetical protein